MKKDSEDKKPIQLFVKDGQWKIHTETKAKEPRTFSESEVLEIVDSCFHCYASSFRNEAIEHAQDLMKGE